MQKMPNVYSTRMLRAQTGITRAMLDNLRAGGHVRPYANAGTPARPFWFYTDDAVKQIQRVLARQADVLAATDAARYLGVSRQHFYKLRKRARLKAYPMPGRKGLVYRRRDLERLAAARA